MAMYRNRESGKTVEAIQLHHQLRDNPPGIIFRNAPFRSRRFDDPRNQVMLANDGDWALLNTTTWAHLVIVPQERFNDLYVLASVADPVPAQ